MALQEVAIPIAFSGGVDTKTDPKTVVSTKLLALENAVFTRSTTLSKRTGYDALSRNVDDSEHSPYTTPHGLAARGNDLVLFADDHLYSYRESSGTWSYVGHAHPVTHTERALAATGTDQSMPDMATLGGMTTIAWEDSRGGVWYSIAESETGRLLLAPRQLSATGISPRVVVCGDRMHVYYATAATNRIYVVVINPSTYGDVPVPAILVDTLSNTEPQYDAMTLAPALGAGVCMVWILDTGGYRVAYIDPSGVIGSPATGWPSAASWVGTAADGPIAIVCDSQPGVSEAFIGVVFTSGYDVLFRFLKAADLLDSISSSFVFEAMAKFPARLAATTVVHHDSMEFEVSVFIEQENTDGVLNARDNRIFKAAIRISGTDTVSNVPLRGHGLASRAFTVDNKTYVCIAQEVPFFPYVALIHSHLDTGVSPPNHTGVGRFVVGSSDGLPERSHLPSVSPVGDRLQVALVSRDQVNASPDGGQFAQTGIRSVRMYFNDPNALQSVNWGNDLIIAGSLPMRYDGDTVAELGFYGAPDGSIPAVASTGAGSLELLGTYLYRCCYEEVDAQGLISPGGMSIDTLIELTGTENTVTLTIPTCRLTAKREASIRIAVFRTEANDTAGDSPAFYRVTSLDPSAITGANRYIPNDTTVDTVTFADNLSDLALLTRERAYTNEGVLSNDPAPLGSVVVAGKDRIFWSDPTDPNIVRFSQTRRDGYQPEVSADLSLRIDQSGGDIGAMAILDDALVVFEERAVHFVLGPGPLANPDAAPQIGFSPPIQIPSDAEGCSRPRSIAQTSSFIMFQTQDGAIKMLGRDRSIQYIGAPVEAFNGQTVTSADEIPGKEQIVFLTASGKSLLFDHYHNQWSTWTNHTGLDGVLVGDTYHYLRAGIADLRVFRSNGAVYLDAGVSYSMYAETAWIKFAGYLQGLQKVWYALILGTYVSPHVLVFRVGIDYKNSWGNPYLIDVDADHDATAYGEGLYGEGVYGGDDDVVYQQRVHVGAKCEAIRFSFADAASPAPQGASFELTELLLTGGMMRPSMVFGSGRTQ